MIDYETYCKIKDCHGRQQLTVGQTARVLGLNVKTVAKWLRCFRYHARRSVPRPSLLDPFKARIVCLLETHPYSAHQLFQRLRDEGYGGGISIVKDYVRGLRARERGQFDGLGWMLAVLQKNINVEELKQQTGDLPEFDGLLNRLYTGRLSDRNKSLSVLSCHFGLRIKTICTFLGIAVCTYGKYKRIFAKGGCQALFARRPCSTRKSDDETLKGAIFKVLHEPPSNYGINRTTWTMRLLRRILSQNGQTACPDVVRTIIRGAGYHWRKARVVLTSKDPTYREKLNLIHTILAGLQADEGFFSIDEYGPFAVKMYSGRKLFAPDDQAVIPQWQKSRGSLIVTAALELSSNQITHFYSEKKNTEEMIKMLDVLVTRYADRRKIYLSWDAASWHISKRLNQRIDEHNSNAATSGGVVVETAPLPSGAQFLNVIESVFSGMSRAIIHNSDYPSADDAKAAIDRHFAERNDHFQRHPQRAGKKIWGKERESATFSESSNCKDPRYR
jgi:transposase